MTELQKAMQELAARIREAAFGYERSAVPLIEVANAIDATFQTTSRNWRTILGR